MNKKMLGLFFVAIVAAILVPSPSGAVGPYSYLELVSVDRSTTATAVNDRGEVVGYSWGFAWHYSPSSKGVTYIPGMEGTYYSYAHDINNNGYIVGIRTLEFGETGFVYSQNTGMLALRPSSNPNGICEAYGINNSGEIVGHAGSLAKWTFDGNSVTGSYDLGNPPDWGGTYGWAINDDGLILANADVPRLKGEGHDWTALPAVTNQFQVSYSGNDLNNRGDVVGQSRYLDNDATYSAVLWPGGGAPILLGALLQNSEAQAINEHGVIVGQSIEYAEGMIKELATIWVKEGESYQMYDLTKLVSGLPEGVILYGAMDINEDGWIVGWSNKGAYLLQPVPLPGSLLLLGTGLLGLGAVGRRRKRG